MGDFVTACAAAFLLRDDGRDLSWQCSCELPEGHDGDHGIYGFSARDCICYPGMCPMECEIGGLHGVAPGSYSDRAIRERRVAASRCTCPPAVGKDDCPVHGYIPIFDHKGKRLA